MYLTPEQLEMLRYIRSGMSWEWHVNEQHDAILHYLMEKRLAEPLGRSGLKASQEGLSLLAQIDKENKRRFWATARAWITLGIALAGLFLSIVNTVYIVLR